jgi:hypothetical protein
LEKWFDYKSSPFKLFSSINLKNKLPEITDLIAISELFNLNIDGDKLYNELNRLNSVSSVLVTENSLNSTEIWCKFFKCCDDSLKLQIIIQTVFAISCSNSYEERVFIVMGSLWTQERNRLKVEMVKANSL